MARIGGLSRRCARLCEALGLACALAAFVLPASVVRGEVHLPRQPLHEAITVRADAAARWMAGEYEVRRLQGHVSITHGATVTRCDDAVVWVEHPGKLGEPTKLIVYVEGAAGRPVALELYESPAAVATRNAKAVARQQATDWFGRLWTSASIDWRTPEPTAPPIGAKTPAIYTRGFARFQPAARGVRQAIANIGAKKASNQIQQASAQPASVQPAQFQGPLFNQPPVPPPGPTAPNATGFRQIQINPRSGVGGRGEYIPQPGGESIGVVSGGVNIIVEGIELDGLPAGFGPVDKIDLETDRAVIWTAGDIGLGGSFQQQNDAPLEIYMEGNIVFRQGDRTVYAERMYYDVRSRTGVILNAELLTPLPEVKGYRYRGLVRLKADVIRQLDESRFVATDALFTTSRLEEPSYSLNSDTIAFQDIRRPVIDPATGIVSYEHERLARSQNNFVKVGGVPLLYWPTIATNLEKPTFYLDDVRIRNDSIFGFQTLFDFNVYQLLGMEEIDGTEWDLSLDYLSDRGLGYGTEFTYQRDEFFGFLGPAAGRVDAWAIDDGGVDNLGFGRRTIVPEESYRGRLFWNHRQHVTQGLLQDWTVQAEVGWISDRTFLEQYYESEWDENKDQTTGVRIKRVFENQSISLEANGRLNHFFTQTQWLPRLDHYLLGQELFGETFTWFARSQLAYANLKVASEPTNADLAADFDLFPYEIDGDGERVATRQEIDAPIDFSPFKIVPYALGELAHWGSDIGGEDLQRAYLQTGVRASIPMWAVNPAVQDPLFNLNGLAHKVVFDAELSYADANENYDDLPLYDALDDDALEEIRRNLFNPPFPVRFDPRFYAIRSGIQSWVTSPTTELVEDQTAVRLGMRHRLQTKRGAPGQQRIVDWLTFDSNISLFPDANRDNFGEELGLADYDLQWRLGDRFTIVSDGFADVFDDGLRTISGGVRVNRPSRANVYLGYRTIRGPFSADLITATVNYRSGPKWLLTGSTVIDFSEAGNIGQSFSLSRIGESLIATVGVRVDESKDNIGFSFLVEPRALPRLSLTRRTGIDIPPAGVEYLE